MLIIKPSLPDNVRMGVESKVTETLEGNGGKLVKTDVWGKKHLAYKIEKHAEGYYIVYEFETIPSQITLIEKSLKLNKDILRYLLINREK